MDSKIRKMAILASMGVILLVSLLVLYANGGTGGKKDRPSQMVPSQTVPSQMVPSQTVPSQTAQPRPESGQEQAQIRNDGVVNGQIGDDLSAFLKDDAFFDPEVNPILEEAMENATRLSLVVTSVEKDLRIQIVDMEGKPVTGQSFYVQLDGLGEYKDLDKDGIIYIGDLAAGEYSVELMPVEGYRVPANETRVRVKDKVEYVAIDDISLLLLTEEDIDAEAEDTAVADALADADSTEIQKLQKATANSRVGIDVSKWNGDIDWDMVKSAGVEFAIIRAGYRGSVTGSLVEDPCFVANIRGASASGIPVGVYFFTQAVNEVEAVEEASAVLQLIREYDLEYPVFIDTEGAGGNGRADGLDPDTRTLVCEAFCRTISNAGYRAGVYGSRNWYNNNLHAQSLEHYCIWLAEYRSAPLYQGYYQMWQYTSRGSVEGIMGNVDMNISYLP